MADTTISAEIEPREGRAGEVARALQSLGLRILHRGVTISVDGPRSVWESAFNVEFVPVTTADPVAGTADGAEFLRARTDDLTMPDGLDELVANVAFVEPPQFFP